MWHLKVVVLLMAVRAVVLVSIGLDDQLEKDSIIEKVNGLKTTWKAGRNFPPHLKESYGRHLCGVKERPKRMRLPILKSMVMEEKEDTLPKSFDARKKWPYCKSIGYVPNQGPCGSCWAVSTSTVFTDRLCIATNGTFNKHLSVQEVLTCCEECGEGCGGGLPEEAWFYFTMDGLCTGGYYGSEEGCQPYTITTCKDHLVNKDDHCTDKRDSATPKCQRKCYNKDYKDHSYADDHHKVEDAVEIDQDPLMMKREIFTFGPIVAALNVHEDFYSYDSGVYKKTSGRMTGGHALKLIGWGVENGVDYWLGVNSWGKNWGENGTVKILRGVDECGIEGRVSAAYPVTST